MGTYWRVRLAAAPDLDLGAVRAAIVARLDGIVAEMSHWAPDSLLSRFNEASGGSWTALPADFAAVMECGLAIAQRSAGAFDPAIGRLTDLYGLGPNPAAGEPGTTGHAAALAVSGWQRLALDAEARRLRQPGGLWLDLSGIAKGHAADVVADLLGRMGVRHALVEIGGECVGRGLRPDSDPWWVDLETPPGLSLPPLRIALHQLAVATSGNYVRGDHTLDPRTGLPVRNGIVSVSVLHASAMRADAWASALTVLGLPQGPVLAEREGLAARFVIARGGVAEEWLSPALKLML
ncbi:MAG: FAD:protein FMN transferase [Sphingobium sp.]|nr:FAD:protein FMN transferase [Sphingobium sp.]